MLLIFPSCCFWEKTASKDAGWPHWRAAASETSCVCVCVFGCLGVARCVCVCATVLRIVRGNGNDRRRRQRWNWGMFIIFISQTVKSQFTVKLWILISKAQALAIFFFPEFPSLDFLNNKIKYKDYYIDWIFNKFTIIKWCWQQYCPIVLFLKITLSLDKHQWINSAFFINY